MLHWVRRGCDGFRCDVGSSVPLDFWVEAVTACKKVKPDLVMINEGIAVDYLEKAFDACYAFPFSFALREFVVPETPVRFKGSFYKGETLPEIMASVREYEAKVPAYALMFSFADNHDTAFDDGEMRMDRVRPVEAGNALFVIVLLRRGLPLIYNGNEIADNAMNATLAPVEHPLRANKTVDWGRALQPAGQKRLSLLRRLAKLRHEMPVFSEGIQEWVTEGESKGVVAFVRRFGDVAVFVAANLTNKAVEFKTGNVRPNGDTEPLLSENGGLDSAGVCRLGPYGYVVMRM
jgi:glycosidase